MAALSISSKCGEGGGSNWEPGVSAVGIDSVIHSVCFDLCDAMINVIGLHNIVNPAVVDLSNMVIFYLTLEKGGQ